MFDSAAANYDRSFTTSLIGKYQRAVVRGYLDNILNSNEEMNILELNCGTGEDALYLAEKGHFVTATDISKEMIKITKQKIDQKGLNRQVTAIRADMRELNAKISKMEFDLIFSNFGGLNCISPAGLSQLSEMILHFLKPRGRMIAVLMPEYSAWEMFYFLVKGEWKKMFRRSTGKALFVNVSDAEVETWYYSPSKFYQNFKKSFRKITIRPVGFFLPPSYLEPFFKRRAGFLKLLSGMERIICRQSFTSGFSDHYLIDLQRIN